MEKSFDSSDLDIETSSIFNRRSNVSSPYHVGTKKPSPNTIAKADKTQANMHLDFSAPLFPPVNFGLKSNTQSSPLTYMLDHNKLIQDDKLDNLLNYKSAAPSSVPVNKQPRLLTPKSKQGLDPLNSKLESLESIMSTAISTKSMILVKPRTLPDITTPCYDDEVNTQDHSNKSVTTFYLKNFNAFARNGYSLQKSDDSNLDAINSQPRKKKVKRSMLNGFAPKSEFQSDNIGKNKKSGCACKNSSCIKMYCECFRTNGVCSPECGCTNCKNVEGDPDRALMVEFLVKRQSSADQHEQLKTSVNKASTGKGCNCKKSMCQKKYCECFNQGAFCNPECCCANCLNTDNS